MHALFAIENGFEVFHFEQDRQPRLASVRNFGLIWVSGRLAGAELELSLRARELWSVIGSKTNVGFRANGSLTIAQTESEFAVINEAASMPDANKRGFRVLNLEETRSIEPQLLGNFVGSLQCLTDAVVEPNLVLNGLRVFLNKFPNYNWIPEVEVIDFLHNDQGNHLLDNSKKKYSGDYIVICPGAKFDGFLKEHLAGTPLRKVRLQMAATAPINSRISHSIADADSLRYYPAFKDVNKKEMQPQSKIAAKYNMQLLAVQRLSGSLTIGDTHEYEEPFAHEVSEEPYVHLSKVLSNILGQPAPQIVSRWDGVYSQSTNEDIFFTKQIAPGVKIVTGAGGRGNTLSPAIAEEIINKWI